MTSRSKYRTIQLAEADYDELMAAANRLKGPIQLDVSGAAAVRLITRFIKAFNDEQTRKYNEAIDMWRKEEGK